MKLRLNRKSNPPAEALNMTHRNRAWRRKQTRTVVRKIAETKNWIVQQFTTDDAKRGKSFEKRHREGALTHRQELKLRGALFDQASEGISTA